MIAAVLHALAIGALGVLVRRQIVSVPALWRVAAGSAGALAAAILIGPTQARVHDVTNGFVARDDLLAAAGPAGDLATVVLLTAMVVLTLPRTRGSLVGNGATPLECRVANDLNHRS
jgi:hypothetical protein